MIYGFIKVSMGSAEISLLEHFCLAGIECLRKFGSKYFGNVYTSHQFHSQT